MAGKTGHCDGPGYLPGGCDGIPGEEGMLGLGPLVVRDRKDNVSINCRVDSLAQMETEMKKKVLDSQSLWDIAIRESGDISGVWEIAEKQDIGLTEELTAGEELEIPPEMKNRKIARFYDLYGIYPATGITIESMSGEGALLLEGIEFWGIEYDFIIS